MPRFARRPRRPTPKFHLSYDPADITRFAADYMDSSYKGRTAADEDREMEEAGSRIVNGAFSGRDVQTIYRWKSARRMDLFAQNTDAQIEQAVINAIVAKTPREAIESLTCLSGVGVDLFEPGALRRDQSSLRDKDRCGIKRTDRNEID